MIEELIEDLHREEGWVPHAYQDHLGYWTIGPGILIDERKGGHIPRFIADQWMMHIITQKIAELDRRIPWFITQPDDVRRALANMAYQMGVDGVLKFKKMLLALESGDRKFAAIEALDSKWASQTPERASRVTKLLGGE